MFPVLNRLKKLDINQMLNTVLKSLENEIIAMNTDEQLFNKGVTIKNVKITPGYAKSTKRAKIRKGQPINRVTTRDRGDYHRSFTVDFRGTEFEIDATMTTNKGFDLSGHLEKRYNGLEGLTEESITKLTDMIRPQLIKLVRSAI